VFADSVRGVIEDKEGFVEQMEMLVSCNARDDKAQKAIKNRMGLIVERKQYKCNLSPVRKGWADKLFETISSQGGTVVAMSEFLRVLQTQDGSTTKADVLSKLNSDSGPKDLLHRGDIYTYFHGTTRGLDNPTYTASMQYLIASAAPGTALAPHRIPKANELFAALDADSKGQMDISVFVNLIDLVAPQLSATEVASTLAVTGEPCRSGALQRRHLYAWLHEVYGELQDCHFNEAMAELIKLAVAQVPQVSLVLILTSPPACRH